ncbi:unnamed protein product [Meloidogyne enterolobii]|uniref:Uncharacterized protein n=1 Tax=Meloidogyne enterolobii TaxID=390850 RepID=A0ACB0YLV7_MELEN
MGVSAVLSAPVMFVLTDIHFSCVEEISEIASETYSSSNSKELNNLRVSEWNCDKLTVSGGRGKVF